MTAAGLSVIALALLVGATLSQDAASSSDQWVSGCRFGCGGVLPQQKTRNCGGCNDWNAEGNAECKYDKNDGALESKFQSLEIRRSVDYMLFGIVVRRFLKPQSCERVCRVPYARCGWAYP